MANQVPLRRRNRGRFILPTGGRVTGSRSDRLILRNAPAAAPNAALTFESEGE